MVPLGATALIRGNGRMLGRIRGWRQRWQAHSRLEKTDLYSRGTLNAMLWLFLLSWGVLPLAADVPHRPLPLALAAALLLANTAQCIVANRILGTAYDDFLGKADFPRRWLSAPLALLALTTALLVALTTASGHSLLLLLAVDVPMAMMVPYALLVPVRTFLLHSVVYAALTVGTCAAAGLRGAALASLFPVLLAAGGLVLLTVRPGAWSLRNMWQQEEAKEIQARLAVAEERLRFGRDMHDVLGHNLAVIALKSELAVQLAQRGRPEAVAQMVEVQRIAQESQREVREVVRGYREADLEVELDGARSVLEAAGIDCTFAGNAEGLPPKVQSALGWVVREAATNVLRHGDPRTCAVRLSVSEGAAVLVVENDGAVRAPAGGGSGLTGLRERLAALGGTLEAGPTGNGMFRLTAEVPR
ncbi:sensor histidine kinase [Streptomyces sp. NPDC054841]